MPVVQFAEGRQLMPARKKPVGTKQDRRPQRQELGLSIVKADTASIQSLSPPAPEGIEDGAVEIWNAYWASPSAAVALDVDRLGVATRWILAVDEHRRSLRAFRRKRIVSGSTGQPTLNPLSAWIKSREDVIAKCESELGLTPYARQRLGIAVGQAAMTAAELNRMTEDAHGNEDAEQVIDAEILDDFEEA